MLTLSAHTIFVHSALLLLQDFFPSALNCQNIFKIPLPFWKEFGIPALILPKATQIVPVLCVLTSSTDNLLIWLEC